MANIPVKLTDWAEAHIKTLIQASADSFDQAFDNFVANDAHITLNGKQVSRDAYKKAIKNERSGETSATVKFLATVEIPTKNSDPEDGTAGIFYNATIRHDPKPGVPQAVVDSSSMNMTVKDQPIQHPPPGHVPIPVDLRRVFTLNHVQSIERILFDQNH